jgi:hypothetical protein
MKKPADEQMMKVKAYRHRVRLRSGLSPNPTTRSQDPDSGIGRAVSELSAAW